MTEWDITILATDINPDYLRKARAGRYREWSFRGTPAWFKTGYFSKSASDEYELAPRVRQMVSFSYLNLVNDVYPSLVNNTSAMDVILCRNVMMYFAADRARLVAGRFHRALLDGGWLVMSPSEGCIVSAALFARTSFDNASLYRKSGTVAAPMLPLHDLSATDGKGTCVISGSPQARPPWSDEIRTMEGEAVLSRREHDVYTSAPALSSSLPEAYPESSLATATAAYAQADYEAVLRIASALLEPAAPILVLAAHACANLGRLDEALAWCRTALERDKLRASIYHLQATVLVAKHDEPAALEALKRVLYLEPLSVLAHFTMANLMLQTGEPAKAMKYLRKTMSLLHVLDNSAVVPDSDGMTADRLKVIVKHIQESLAKT